MDTGKGKEEEIHRNARRIAIYDEERGDFNYGLLKGITGSDRFYSRNKKRTKSADFMFIETPMGIPKGKM